jgi:hypothetical protein
MPKGIVMATDEDIRAAYRKSPFILKIVRDLHASDKRVKRVLREAEML